MSKQLYEEALADVKKLKEVAEDNAKRALLEAVTPRIKDLIENQLLGEVEADKEKILHDEEDDEDSDKKNESENYHENQSVELEYDSGISEGSEEEYELNSESAQSLGMLLNDSNFSFDKRILKLEKKINLLSKSSAIIKESKGYKDTVFEIISEVENMYSHLQSFKDSLDKTKYESILENFYTTLKQLTEQKMNKNKKKLSEADVTLKLTGLPDEIDLDSVGVDLITGEEEGGEEEAGEEEDLGGEEGEEEEGGEEEDLDLGGEEGEEEGGEEELDLGDEEEEKKEGQMESRRLSNNLVVEIDEGMLRREIARMRSLREEKVPSVKGFGPGKVADGFEDDDLGDPFVDIDLRESDGQDDLDELDQQDEKDQVDEADMDQVVELDMEEQDDLDELYQQDEKDQVDEADMDEADMDEADMDQAKDQKQMGGNQDEQSDKQSRQPGKTVESIRRRLRAEARIQSEAKQKATQAKKQQKKSQQEAQQQAKKGQKTQAQKKKQQSKKMQEAYNFYAKRFNESVARSRRLKGMLSEAVRRGRTLNGAPARSAAETQNLRNKLAETNLFNAKLLFTNKLLQNESLTKRQKAEIIERLDEAKTSREAKLVYESLVKTLQGTPSRLSESATKGVIGSSSRPMRPASANTLNEGFETDRWARLAGITK